MALEDIMLVGMVGSLSFRVSLCTLYQRGYIAIPKVLIVKYPFKGFTATTSRKVYQEGIVKKKITPKGTGLLSALHADGLKKV